MQLKGTIFRIFPLQNISSTFRKREIVLEIAENPAFPQFIKIEAIQEKAEWLEKFSCGENISCEVNIKGRVWVNQQGGETFFNTIEIYKIHTEK